MTDGDLVARTVSFCRSSVRYSTGDLPSTRARSNPGSREAVRVSTPSKEIFSRYALVSERAVRSRFAIDAWSCAMVAS